MQVGWEKTSDEWRQQLHHDRTNQSKHSALVQGHWATACHEKILIMCCMHIVVPVNFALYFPKSQQTASDAPSLDRSAIK